MRLSNIMFFNIPAHGHINPTIEVVRELVLRGHCVRYYSFSEFREKIEEAGAEYISCEEFLPPQPDDLDQKVGRDFAALIEMVVDTTLALEDMVASEVAEFHPDCIVSDSVCFWGKLFAWKYEIPFVCSTTTLAFNRYTASLMKKGFGELIRSIAWMPRINRKIRLLNEHGYRVKSFISIVQNDNDTNTIVYTSRLFQPRVETFSDRYVFVGPSVKDVEIAPKDKHRPQIYISLGTVLNRNLDFYRSCIAALKDVECDVIISAGRNTDVSQLGKVPPTFSIKPYVNQLEVLANTDVFVSHCGMNSVSESLYFGVPMVLFPQHSEENAVAIRTEELGAGVRLKRPDANEIKRTVEEVLSDKRYRERAEKIGRDFRNCQGAVGAADFIQWIIR